MYDRQKAIETVKYVLYGLEGKVLVRLMGDPHDPAETVLAVIYAADKLHLSRYGRTITGDTYRVGRRSVVPEQTARIIYYDEAPAEFTFHTFHWKARPLRPVNLAEFSETDLECLAETLDQCRSKTPNLIAELGRDEIYRNAEGFPMTAELDAVVRTFSHADGIRDDLNHLWKAARPVSLADIAATLPNAAAVLALLRREGYIPA